MSAEAPAPAPNVVPADIPKIVFATEGDRTIEAVPVADATPETTAVRGLFKGLRTKRAERRTHGDAIKQADAAIADIEDDLNGAQSDIRTHRSFVVDADGKKHFEKKATVDKRVAELTDLRDSRAAHAEKLAPKSKNAPKVQEPKQEPEVSNFDLRAQRLNEIKATLEKDGKLMMAGEKREITTADAKAMKAEMRELQEFQNFKPSLSEVRTDKQVRQAERADKREARAERRADRRATRAENRAEKRALKADRKADRASDRAEYKAQKQATKTSKANSKPLNVPAELAGYSTINQKVYKNGAKHVYGVDADNKQRQLSHDGVLASYGYGKEDLPTDENIARMDAETTGKGFKNKVSGSAISANLLSRLMTREQKDSTETMSRKKKLMLAAGSVALVGVGAYLANRTGLIGGGGSGKHEVAQRLPKGRGLGISDHGIRGDNLDPTKVSNIPTKGARDIVKEVGEGVVKGGTKKNEIGEAASGTNISAETLARAQKAVNSGEFTSAVAEKLTPGHETETMQAAIDKFNTAGSTHFELVPKNGTTWIMDGKKAINPSQMRVLNQMMVDSLAA